MKLFENMVMLHIKIVNGFKKFSNMVANILPADPLPPATYLGGGIKRSNSTFSEHGHVAYQIKVEHKFSNMVANTLLQTTHAQP